MITKKTCKGLINLIKDPHKFFTISSIYLFQKIVKPKEVITNKIAAYVVHLPSIPFNVLALFFPKNVSAPPAISPEIPALLPDCKITIKISDKHTITCTTNNMFLIIINSTSKLVYSSTLVSYHSPTIYTILFCNFYPSANGNIKFPVDLAIIITQKILIKRGCFYE